MDLNAKGKRVLIIPDTHHPYQHKDLKKFLSDIKRIFKPQIVIHLGDEVDNHAISFHDHMAELFSAGHELDKAIEYLQDDLHALFPKMFLLESNHGSLLYRRLRHASIPIRTLMPLEQLYRTPKWSWHHDIILHTKLGPLYLCHGKTATIRKLALTEGMSAGQGHFHGEMYIHWMKFANRMVYDMKCGCLIDAPSLAFAYGKNNLPKPMLGATLIHEDGMPEQVLLI